jgi:osmoprotectant transport system ATP-binding protein
VIHLENVSKSYDGKPALLPTTLDVPPERCLALIGPSGCGKSTLLRLIVGLLLPESGSITIGGARLSAETRTELRHRIGYVIQDGGLFPHLTAAQNVALLARHLGWDDARCRARLEELAGLAQLPPELLDRYPSQLSGGQRQRVGLMRALMLDPEVLLMDEPLGALDPIIRSHLQQDLRSIFHRLKKTVLLVTHDMGEAAYLGDEIALMREGRVVQRGSARELLRHPAEPFVAEFIGAQRPLWTEDAEAGA